MNGPAVESHPVAVTTARTLSIGVDGAVVAVLSTVLDGARRSQALSSDVAIATIAPIAKPARRPRQNDVVTSLLSLLDRCWIGTDNNLPQPTSLYETLDDIHTPDITHPQRAWAPPA